MCKQSKHLGNSRKKPNPESIFLTKTKKKVNSLTFYVKSVELLKSRVKAIVTSLNVIKMS